MSHVSMSLQHNMERLATCDFLLIIHSNHGHISYRVQDKQQFRSKVANFSHPYVFKALTTGFQLEFYSGEDQRTVLISIPDHYTAR